MAAPTLQAQGTTAGVTSGTLAPTVPTHQADDILIADVNVWVPASAGAAAQIPTPTSAGGGTWIAAASQIQQPAGTADGWFAWFWLRATGGSETCSFAYDASWDASGTDHVYAARIYVIRGSATSGDPWDAAVTSGPHTAASQNGPAVTVSGTERMVVMFCGKASATTTAMTRTGWTTGTASSTTAGTDAIFNTARIDNTASSTAAGAHTVLAPTSPMAYAYLGVSFTPPAPSTPHTYSQPDAMAGTDSKASAVGKTQADTLAGTDAQSHVWSAVKPLSETPSATDALSQTVTKSVADSGTLTDSITPLLILTQRIDDGIAGTDSLVMGAGKGLADTAQGVDAIAKAPTHVLTDAFAGTDAQARAWAALISLADNGNWTDAAQPVGSGGANWTQTVNESITGTDAVLQSVVYLRALGDAIAGSDAVTAGIVPLPTRWLSSIDARWLATNDSNWPVVSDSQWPNSTE